MSSYGRHTENPGWDSGDNWVVCDICGFDIRASDIKETWDHLLVCPEDYNPRHEQDFVRSRKDKIVATIIRPTAEGLDISPIYGATIAGEAIAGISFAGSSPSSVIPSGTFNPNTL